MRHKPENGAKASDYEVRKVPHKQARDFILENHYSGGAANTSTDAFGIFRAGHLVGAAMWMPPTRVCAESVDRDQWRKVVSLSRLACLGTEPANTESLFIGRMLRALKKEGRWTKAVTFADESQGHVGTIYKATNWTYVGRTNPEPRWVDSLGRQVSRKATKSRTKSDMLALGYICEGKFSKHKFVFSLV